MKQSADDSKSPGAGKSSGYHHGDLRNALIVAAAELIEERGPDDFAMIDAARRAGVSSAAPYRHFKDRDDLLDEVAGLGFLALAEQSMAIVAQHEPGSEACVIALGKGYIRFVTEHAAFYDLMWGDRLSRHDNQDGDNLPANGFYVFVGAVQAWCNAEDISRSEPLDLSLKLWAMALGLSSLAINHQLERFVEDIDVYQLLETSALTFLEGVRQGR